MKLIWVKYNLKKDNALRLFFKIKKNRFKEFSKIVNPKFHFKYRVWDLLYTKSSFLGIWIFKIGI